jgi:hypothetical protein
MFNCPQSIRSLKTHKYKLGFADKDLFDGLSISRRLLNYILFRKHPIVRDGSPPLDRTPKLQRHSPLQIEIRSRSPHSSSVAFAVGNQPVNGVIQRK